MVVAGDDGLGRKPDAGPFLTAVTKLNATPSQAIFVGDRIDDDCEGALNAGLGAFLIQTGQYPRPTGPQPAGYISLTQLGKLLDHLPIPSPAMNGADKP